jgi:hypothetical protein
MSGYVGFRRRDEGRKKGRAGMEVNIEARLFVFIVGLLTEKARTRNYEAPMTRPRLRSSGFTLKVLLPGHDCVAPGGSVANGWVEHG